MHTPRGVCTSYVYIYVNIYIYIYIYLYINIYIYAHPSRGVYLEAKHGGVTQ